MDEKKVKAKFVYENMRFERGIDPRAAMGLGMREKMKKMMKKSGWHYINDNHALIWSSVKGHKDIVEFLLKAGANVHADDNLALRWASEKGHIDIIELLLKAGANIHAMNDQALQLASKYGHKDVVELLKKYMSKK